MCELEAIFSVELDHCVIQNLLDAALRVPTFLIPTLHVKQCRDWTWSELTLVLSSELTTRFGLLDTPDAFAFPFPFSTRTFLAVALDFPFTVPSAILRVFIRVSVFAVRLERLRGTGSTSCGLRDRLREVDGPGSCGAVQRAAGRACEPDTSAFGASVVSGSGVVVSTGSGSSPRLLASPR